MYIFSGEVNEVRFSSADVAIYIIMVALEFQHSIIIVNNSVKIAMWTVNRKFRVFFG